jgi:adenylate cyclase
MVERNANVPQEKRIEFRIGINVGDIIIDRGDIFGDGVNVAARLEGLAEPGGICVSARVREYAQDQLNIIFEDVGEQQLKNIPRPVRAYRVRLYPAGKTRPAPAVPKEDGAVVPRLSILVLPFANLSNDPEQEYFADGLTHDLTTDLSQWTGSFVIACSTAFNYKGKEVDATQIGRKLHMRYVVERLAAICGPSASTVTSQTCLRCRMKSPDASLSHSITSSRRWVDVMQNVQIARMRSILYSAD